MNWNPLQILLLTRNPTTTVLEASLRKSQDLEVVGVFSSCLAAMSFIDMRLPDLFIFDIDLDGNDSIFLAKKLEQQKVPYLLYSIVSIDLSRLDAAFHTAVWFGKPNSTEELFAIIRAAAALGRRARNFMVTSTA